MFPFLVMESARIQQYPGLRRLFISGNVIKQAGTSEDKISALWARSREVFTTEWGFHRHFAVACVADGDLSRMAEEIRPGDLVTIQNAGESPSLIERLLVAADSGGTSNFIAIRYLGGILGLASFWVVLVNPSAAATLQARSPPFVPGQSAFTPSAHHNPDDSIATPAVNAFSAFENDLDEPAGPEKFRVLPLFLGDLPNTMLAISTASFRPDDRDEEALTLIVDVDPGNNQDLKVQKTLADVLALDVKIRAGLGKRGARLLEASQSCGPLTTCWDLFGVYRKEIISTNLPVHLKPTLITFLMKDFVTEDSQDLPEHKHGFLIKRGKNFGRWKMPYFLLDGPVTTYFDYRGGTLLASVDLTGSQIGTQQKRPDNDENMDYRHAFLIIEAKKIANRKIRYVLCAKSDKERDEWVKILTSAGEGKDPNVHGFHVIRSISVHV
ncbi:hypothetical protein DFH09DRAFT_1422894 [Mycena vulgaris]|nr:hypothetical protein DFH09DRAFT_1422894 [Mycena vulgaris]